MLNSSMRLARVFLGLSLLALLVLGVRGMASHIVAKPEPPVLGRLPSFKMSAVTTNEQIATTNKTLSGRVWIADFIFTRCQGPCPILSTTMASLQNKLPDGVGFLSFSVDPDYDTAPVLRRYAGRFGAQPGRWLFLTGKKEALYKLIADGFRLPVAGSGPYAVHSTKFVLVDRDGAVRGYYDSDDTSAVSRLIADARRLSRPR